MCSEQESFAMEQNLFNLLILRNVQSFLQQRCTAQSVQQHLQLSITFHTPLVQAMSSAAAGQLYSKGI